jgi:cold shock CspA family protein
MLRLGIVSWWDKTTGEGEILDLGTGRTFYVHYSAIENSFNQSRLNLEKDHLVEMKLYRNLYMTQVDKCRILEPDFDYEKVNICLEMCFKRGVDILRLEAKY